MKGPQRVSMRVHNKALTLDRSTIIGDIQLYDYLLTMHGDNAKPVMVDTAKILEGKAVTFFNKNTQLTMEFKLLQSVT